MSKAFETKTEVKKNPLFSLMKGIIAGFIVVGISISLINNQAVRDQQVQIEQLQAVNDQLNVDLHNEKHKSFFKRVFYK